LLGIRGFVPAFSAPQNIAITHPAAEARVFQLHLVLKTLLMRAFELA
jgi:hypothetical protein